MRISVLSWLIFTFGVGMTPSSVPKRDGQLLVLYVAVCAVLLIAVVLISITTVVSAVIILNKKGLFVILSLFVD